MKKIIVISLLVSAAIMIASYLSFTCSPPGDRTDILSFPFGITAAFSFGSGKLAFYTVLSLEILVLAIIIFCIIFAFRAITCYGSNKGYKFASK